MTIAERQGIATRNRSRLLAMARASVAIWRRRMSTRAALRRLDAHFLPDVGLIEEERRRECAKWFWQK
jgi:uncharacterized protein YjiS (DUF1127 family)